MSQKLVFTPLSYVGIGALDHLMEELKRFAPEKVIVVTDPVLAKLGIVEKVTKPIVSSGVELSIFSEVEPEPKLELAERLVNFVQQEKGDLVIGIGGGSALDLAKAAAVLSSHEGHVAEYLNLTGTKEINKKGLPKILIPTTSGTGSEVTNITVLSLERTKDVITHDFLLADVTIVDPILTITMPKRVTAATGIDALTHAIEAYLSKNASLTSDALALHAVRLIGRSLRTAVAEGENIDARTDMSEASYMAGLAFFNAGVAGVHALAYPLGGQFNLPHGEANAVLLPYVMRYIQDSCEERMKDLLCALDLNFAHVSASEAKDIFIEKLFVFVGEIGLPTTLAEYDIPSSSIRLLTEDAIEQTRLLARSPTELGFDDIFKIYSNAYHGSK